MYERIAAISSFMSNSLKLGIPPRPFSTDNQGWKDSVNAVLYRDGRRADPPITVCEVQAYVYRAKRLAAEFLPYVGEEEVASRVRRDADTLRSRFMRDFWLSDERYVALALDGKKAPVTSVTSNAGHALWAGLLPPAERDAVAARLTASDMFSGFGVRTMSSAMSGYNPLSYHNGSVWPHDTSIAAMGLRRAGALERMCTVSSGLFKAASRFPLSRLPELFSGFAPSEADSEPIPYPGACSPQAWAAAAPLYCMQALAGVEVDALRRHIVLDPAFPPEIGMMRAADLPLFGRRVTLTMRRAPDGATVETDGLPPDVRVLVGGRRVA